jgi:hypothetical protein
MFLGDVLNLMLLVMATPNELTNAMDRMMNNEKYILLI